MPVNQVTHFPGLMSCSKKFRALSFKLSLSPGMKKLYSKTCVKRTLSKRQKIGFQDQLLLNADQKYCRMRQGEHSAILLTFILQYFQPSLSYHLSLRPLFCLFLSGRFNMGFTVFQK